MKLHRLASVTAAASIAWLAVLPPAGAAEAPSLDRLFPNEAEIEADRVGLVRLPIPADVLAATRPDLSDLRVFDATGREVPYLLDGRRSGSGAVEASETFASRVLSVTRAVEERDPGPSIHREFYRIAAPPEAPEGGAWELVFDVSARRFARTVSVRTVSGDGSDSGTEVTLADDEAVFRLDAETLRLRVPLRAFRADSLAVDIAGEEGFFLEPHFRFESRRVFDPLGAGVVALEELSRERVDGRTIVELARPSGLVPDRLRLATTTGSFQRSVTVFDEQIGRGDRAIGKGRVFRLNVLRGVHELDVKVQASDGTVLRLEIEDGDAPSLDDLRVWAVMRQPMLLFELPTARGTLRFGGGRALRPHYQLQSLLLGARQTLHGSAAEAAARLYDPAQLGLARLGPIRPNPRFDATPALAFAMHPGAEIDERTYSHRRAIQIDPSTEGLSRLALEPADVARARADLADVRVVGSDSRQWPYLMQRAAVTQTLALDVESVESARRVSTLRLAVPVAPVEAQSLTLRAEAPFFDREFRLFAIDEGGKRRALTSGRLVKDGRMPRPSRIGFAAQPIHGLVLEIEDGDDAPLVLQSAEIRVSLPQVFLVAPQGSYWLLVGNPQASEPRYELSRVRDVVLAVTSRAASVQPLEANPAFSLAARLRSPDGPSGLLQTALVWGVLLVAVAVLALLTLRVVRREPPPDGGSSGT